MRRSELTLDESQENNMRDRINKLFASIEQMLNIRRKRRVEANLDRAIEQINRNPL